MLGQNANPLLVKTEDQISAKVPPQFQSAYQRIVLAGEKVLYSDQTRQMVLGQLQQAKGQDPATAVGMAVAKLYGVLQSQSQVSLPPKAGIPAITALLCEAMDFAEKANLLKVTPQTLADAMHALSSGLMQMMGVDQNKLALMAQHAQAKNQPPQPAQPTPPAVPQPAQPAAPAAPPAGLVAQAQGAPQ
jgi:hypothetical protein